AVRRLGRERAHRPVVGRLPLAGGQVPYFGARLERLAGTRAGLIHGVQLRTVRGEADDVRGAFEAAQLANDRAAPGVEDADVVRRPVWPQPDRDELAVGRELRGRDPVGLSEPQVVRHRPGFDIPQAEILLGR